MRGTNRIRERTERWKVSIKSSGSGLASNVYYRPGFILLYIRLQNIEYLYHSLYYYTTVINKLVLFLKWIGICIYSVYLQYPHGLR